MSPDRFTRVIHIAALRVSDFSGKYQRPAPRVVQAPPPPPPLPPEIGTESVEERDLRIAETMEQLDDYRKFENRSRRDPTDKIPGILLDNSKERELLEIVALA